MELPDEILAIIREYIRPRFKYFREYNRILRLTKMVSWPVLKEKLSEDLLPYLLAYEKALIEWYKVCGRRPTLYSHYYWNDPRLALDQHYETRLRRRMSTMIALTDRLRDTPVA